MDPRKRMLLNKKNECAKVVLKQLKTLMETYNISHQEVAEALGVGRTAVTKWLVGERFPLEETLNKIEDYIDNYHISTPGYDLLGDLQTYMIENDVTLQEVAEQIGVTHPTIIRWLRESVYPTPKNIKKIKDFLDRQ